MRVGHSEGWTPLKLGGGLHPGKVPSETRFGPSGLRYGHFPLSTLGLPIAPHIGPRTTQNGPERAPERVQRGVPRSPQCLPCAPIRQWATKRHGPGPRAPGRSVGPFLARSAPFWARSGGVHPPVGDARAGGGGGGPGPITGFRGGDHWAIPTPELEARAGACADF